MISLTSVQPPFQILEGKYKGTVYIVNWIEDWQTLFGTQVLIDGVEFTVKNVDRNRCSMFFNGTQTEWDQRSVWVLV